MKSERFFKKIIIYFIGNFSSKILISLLIPIYAIFVSTEDLGIYDYLQTIMNVCIILAFVAVWEAVLRFILVVDPKSKKVNTDNIICFSCVIAGIIFISTLFISMYCKLNFIDATLNGIMNSSYGIAMVWQYFSRAYEKNMIYVQSGIIGTVVNFIGVIFFVCVLKTGLTGLLVSYSLGRLSIILFIEYKLRFLKSFMISNINLSVLNQILRFSFPLAVNSLAGWMLGGIGSILIIHSLGNDMNGLYAFSTKFSSLIVSLGSIFVMALLEEVLIELKKNCDESGFEEMMDALITLFAVGITLMLPLIGIFYIWISKSDYINSLEYIPLVVFYAFLTVIASALGTLFQVLDKTKYQFITTLLGAGVMIFISIVGLNKISIYAVLIGQVFGAFFMLLSRYIIISETVILRLKRMAYVRHFFVYIGVSLVLIKWKNIYIYSICFLICLIYYYIKYRNKIMLLVYKIKTRKQM